MDRNDGDRRLNPAEFARLVRELAQRSIVSVRRSPGLLLLSLGISVMLWYFVTDLENPTRVDTFPAVIPVEAVNVDQTLAVANTLAGVELRISAPEDEWDRLTPANFRAIVDLNGLRAREQQVPVQIQVSGVRGVRVLQVLPTQITVNLEDFVSKQVPVTTAFSGTVPRGYELGAGTPSVGSVRVSGPASLVQLVESARATVNVTGLTVNIEDTVELVPVSSGGGEIRGVTIEPTSVRVAVSVRQTSIVRTLPLQAELEGAPDPAYRVAGVEIAPAAISVTGSIEVLQGLDAIALSPISIAGAVQDVQTSVQVTLPEGVQATTPIAVSVTVRIEPISGRIELGVVPDVINVGSGLEPIVSEPVLVLLEGPLPLLNGLRAGDLSVTINAEGLSAGQYLLIPEVKAPEGVTVSGVRPPEVSVTLSSQQAP